MGQMTDAPTTDARQLAFAVLESAERSSRFADDLLHAALAAGSLAPADRRLATELVYGIVRRQATIDALIRPHVRRPKAQVETSLWTLLRLGAYQLVFLSAVPRHAAVHETVELARRTGRPQWSGFANGVLRSLARLLTDETVQTPSEDAVPIAGGSYRTLRQAVFADPRTQPAEWFAAAFSFPRWLTDRWTRRFGSEELIRLGFWFNEPPPLILRVNRLRTTRDDYLDALRQAGITAADADAPEGVRAEASRIEDLPGFAEGSFSVQDETAMRAAPLLDPQPGERVLDLCAAPGTKTAHLAELMQNQGEIIATDVRADRLAGVEANARRLGIGIIRTQLIGDGEQDVPAGPFDAILIDAPCSNTGVLGRRAEARWRISVRGIRELSALQRELLAGSLPRLRPGGRLVYSTCSIEPEENQHVVRAVLDERNDLELVSEREYLPGQPADGGYQALLRLKS